MLTVNITGIMLRVGLAADGEGPGRAVGPALLTPGSLAIIESTQRPADRGRAVGRWSGLGGIAAAIGPLVGGVLVDVSWRWAFVLNLPVGAAVVVAAPCSPSTSWPTGRSWPPTP
ncbi:MAG: MFS transporter [Acidimicrobiales bacterium]